MSVNESNNSVILLFCIEYIRFLNFLGVKKLVIIIITTALISRCVMLPFIVQYVVSLKILSKTKNYYNNIKNQYNNKMISKAKRNIEKKNIGFIIGNGFVIKFVLCFLQMFFIMINYLIYKYGVKSFSIIDDTFLNIKIDSQYAMFGSIGFFIIIIILFLQILKNIIFALITCRFKTIKIVKNLSLFEMVVSFINLFYVLSFSCLGYGLYIAFSTIFFVITCIIANIVISDKKINIIIEKRINILNRRMKMKGLNKEYKISDFISVEN